MTLCGTFPMKKCPAFFPIATNLNNLTIPTKMLVSLRESEQLTISSINEGDLHLCSAA